VLPEEDEDRVAAFLGRHPEFARQPATAEAELTPFLTADGDLRLTPRSSGTDGFYVSVLEKAR
jgi:16S rRNA (cytosine967-C5)-methyltransferase